MNTKHNSAGNTSNERVYTFPFGGILIINGEEVHSFELALAPEDHDSIREWFLKRNNKWIGYVPLEFREFNPQLYDRLYMTLIDLENQADVEDWMYDDGFDPDQAIEYDPTLDPSVFLNPRVGWPKEIYQEFGVVTPNISLWCKDTNMGYPVQINEEYLPVIEEVLKMHLEILHKIDIEADFFQKQYPSLYSSLKQAIKEWVPEIDSDEHHFCLYQMTLSCFQEDN